MKQKKSITFIIVLFLICSSLIYWHANDEKKHGFHSKYTKIKVVIDDNYPPYAFRDGNGKIQGIIVDEWRLWEAKTGIEVELDAMDWNVALEKMKDGQYDVIDSIFFNEERDELYNFTRPYEKTEVTMFFNKNICGMTDVDSLKGFPVAVKKGDNCVKFLKDRGVENIKEFNTYEEVVSAARDRSEIVFVMDKMPAMYYLYKNKIEDDFNYSNPLYTGEIRRAVKHGNSELLKTVEAGFAMISEKQYKEIRSKWFGNYNTYEIYARYLKYGILLSSVVMLLLIIWNRTLRRIVDEKTSELVNTVDKLKESKEKYRKLLVNLNVGVAVYSNAREVLICNNKYCKLFGFNEDDIADENSFGKMMEYFIKQDGSKLKNEESPLNMVIETKNPVYDYTLGVKRHMNDEVVWVKTDCIPEYDRQGNVDKVIVTFVDITERIISEKRIYEMGIYDLPTNIYNRNYFEEQIKTYQEKRLMNVGMVICDIDGLKLVNDTLGHVQGDCYIRTVAEVLRSCFRKDDVIARIGGDEFAVLMKDTTDEEIASIKTKVKDMVNQLNHDDSLMPISISVGYTVLKHENKDLNDIFKEADDYMYREKIHHLQSSRSKNVEILMKMLKARDFITEGHGERLQELASKLSQSIGMTEGEIKDMCLLGQFHDIGKVGIPDAILFKPGRLTDEEMAFMRRHTEIGYRIAQASPDLTHISDWIFKHHEQWDGRGYPFGLKGAEIPVQCRMLSIVDAFDAMTNDRPYRKAMDKNEALDEIKRCAGKQFDPMLVEKFVEIVCGNE